MPTDKNEVLRTLAVFHPSPGTVEVRTKWPSGTVMNGYTSDHDAIADWAELCGGEPSIYVTLNDLAPKGETPLNGNGGGTKDADVLFVNWLPIDVDAPRGDSTQAATECERKLALAKANEIVQWMETQGIPHPVAAFSGNGYCLALPVCLPNDSETRWLMRSFTKLLSGKLGTDPSFHGPSQTLRLFGAPNPKGGRDTKIVKVPESLLRVSKEKIKALLEANGFGYEAAKEIDEEDAEGVDAKIEEFLVSHCGLDAVCKEYGDGSKWVMPECPMCGYAKKDVAAVFRSAGGKFGFHCLHEPTCGDIGWKEFREKMEEEHGDFRFIDEWDDSDWSDLDGVEDVTGHEDAPTFAKQSLDEGLED
jgi:hypothetical protein